MERSLFFTNYRNIGISQPQRLVLNNFSDNKTVGNLVILVGPNNSGKSNILDALESYDKNSMSDRDITTLSYEEKSQIPQLSLSYKGRNNEEYTKRITFNQVYNNSNRSGKQFINSNNEKVLEPFIKYPEEKSKFLSSDDDVIELKKAITDLIDILKKYCDKYQCVDTYEIMHRLEEFKENSLNNPDKCVHLQTLYEEMMSVTAMLVDSRHKQYAFGLAWAEFQGKGEHSKFVLACMNRKNASEYDKLRNLFYSVYNMNFEPRIFKYVDTPITNRHIITDKNHFTSNMFYNQLFNSIGYDVNMLKRAYEAFETSGNKGILNMQKIEINNRLKNVAEDFNRLYCLETVRYEFEIDLESSNIYFNIYNGEKAVSLDYQSTGFKWFFNLYFNLLNSKTVSVGDIILMDEPATHLHVKGQCELREFLKKFAISNGITVIVATHLPFLINIDYLDELRVIESCNGESYINNDFSAINPKDSDSLLPIKRALTVNSCQLYDPDKCVVFVEGITDYNYLTAAKKQLNIKEDIVFLPIKGLGSVNSKDCETRLRELTKSLLTLRKHNPILLVDGDKAGMAMKDFNKKYESDLEVITLSDIDQSFKTIESLFSEDDINKFGLVNDNGKFIKHASTSALIKTYISTCGYSEKTQENFKKLFNRLLDRE